MRAEPAAPVSADENGRLVRAVGFDLEQLDAGRYELVLEAREEKSGAVCSYREPLLLHPQP